MDSNFAIAILALIAACVGFAFWLNVTQEDFSDENIVNIDLQVKNIGGDIVSENSKFLNTVGSTSESKAKLVSHAVDAGTVMVESVSIGQSPIPNQQGVKADIGGGVEIFLLTFGTKTDGLKITSIPDATGADMSGAVGQTFFGFTNSYNSTPIVVIESEDILKNEVVACGIERDVCTFPNLKKLSENQYQLTLRPDFYYAFEKE